MNRRAMLAALAASPLLTAAQGAELTAMQAARDAPDPTEEIVLWPAGAPGGEKVTAVETHEERPAPAPGVRDRIVTHTRVPKLVVFRPARPNGVGVLITPGGGYIRVVRDKEGYEAARYLASRGYTCFVLFYRLPGDGWAAGADVALQDAQRAMRVIRDGAPAWRIDANRIGVQGFSAGGHLAASLATRYGERLYSPVDRVDQRSARPDFACLMYPVIALSGPLAHAGSAQAMSVGPVVAVHERVTRDTPPTFIVHSKDDPSVPVGNATLMADALRRAGVVVELQLFEQGGHGYGLRAIERKDAAAWPERFVAWLRRSGFA